jgi:L-ascorbate metabolism protein UlaG (beta-lactamase superfamily)
MVQILSTGSKGNAVLYHGSILIDIGVPFALLRPYQKEIKMVLLTHAHRDHLNIKTLHQLAALRPTLRIGVCPWMLPFVEGLKNVDVMEIGQLYDYRQFQVAPFRLYHDILNCGWRIFKDDNKIFHATDTAHLEGITAKNYDAYCIESNYNEDTVWESIRRIEAVGGYAHQRGSINTHLSEQQCNEFFHANKGDNSVLIRLHESSHV